MHILDKAEQYSPSVDIIIPYYRRRDMLERCLDSLEQCNYPAMGIIVVDNGGTEAGLVFLVKRYRNARLLRLAENRGYAGGCNAGLKSSTADYVVFMNDDTEHDPLWLERLVSVALEDTLIGALQPKILALKPFKKGKKVFDYAGAAGGMIDRLGYPWCRGRTFAGVEPDKGQYESGQDIFWASGVAMFANRVVAEKLGGFDEDFFMQMEEIDLSWRMQLAGYRVRSVPASVVLHEGGASLPGGSFVLPLVYGIGTGVPVLVVAFLLAYSAKSVGKTYNVLSKVEWWARMITGWLFILVGIWFSLTYVFELG